MSEWERGEFQSVAEGCARPLTCSLSGTLSLSQVSSTGWIEGERARRQERGIAFEAFSAEWGGASCFRVIPTRTGRTSTNG